MNKYEKARFESNLMDKAERLNTEKNHVQKCKLLYMWVKQNQINFRQYQILAKSIYKPEI